MAPTTPVLLEDKGHSIDKMFVRTTDEERYVLTLSLVWIETGESGFSLTARRIEDPSIVAKRTSNNDFISPPSSYHNPYIQPP